MKKKIVILIFILLLLIPISVVYNRSVLNNWKPSEALVGTWVGQPKLSSGFIKDEAINKDSDNLINFEITIDEVGNVTGKVGNAELVNCKIKLNRNGFERYLGIKTDYIVTGGYLKNGIVQEGITVKRNITIPFNLKAGEIKGSLFQIEPWKYPDPLFPRLVLVKKH